MAHLNLGHALEQVGRSSEAVEVYRECASLDGNGLKDPKTHEATKISALFHLGRLNADQGRFHEAAVIYREAIDKMPDYYQAQVSHRTILKNYKVCNLLVLGTPRVAYLRIFQVVIIN